MHVRSLIRRNRKCPKQSRKRSLACPFGPGAMGTRTECEAHPTLICDNETWGVFRPGRMGRSSPEQRPGFREDHDQDSTSVGKPHEPRR